MRELRLWGPAVVLFVGIAATFRVARPTSVALAAPLESIPRVLAGRVGTDRTVSEEEQRIARVSDYLFRTYGDGNSVAFTVYVGYYAAQAQGQTIHSPRNCLPGAGWHVVRSSIEELPVAGRSVRVNRYELRSGAQLALVYYWYQGRGRVEASEYRVKWDLVRDAIRSGRSEEALVRIVVPVAPRPAEPIAEATQRADVLARLVAASLVPEIARVLPPAPGDEAMLAAGADR